MTPIDTRPEPPTLPAYLNEASGLLKVWCSHCRHWHTHGHAEGHRVAHCDRPGTPYTSGYYLREAGPWRAKDWDKHGNRKNGVTT